MPMTDPSEGLISFQEALRERKVAVQPCDLDKDLSVHMDQPTPGTIRLTYCRIVGGEVRALVMFVRAEPIDGLPCFQVGYAVPEAHRNQGLATSTLQSAIAELVHGMKRNGVTKFCVEAVVGTGNLPSLRVAEKVLTHDRTEATDEFSGEPATQFVGVFPA